MAASPSAAPLSRLSQVIGNEFASLQEFVTLLQREQELLKLGDAESLLPLIENKNALADKLGTLARAREMEVSRLGLAPGRAGMELWLQKSGGESDRQLWSKLMALAAEARDINMVNGKLIGLHMQHNQQAFTALMNASNRAMTYGPDGQQQAGLGGRILGTA